MEIVEDSPPAATAGADVVKTEAAATVVAVSPPPDSQSVVGVPPPGSSQGPTPQNESIADAGGAASSSADRAQLQPPAPSNSAALTLAAPVSVPAVTGDGQAAVGVPNGTPAELVAKFGADVVFVVLHNMFPADKFPVVRRRGARRCGGSEYAL